MHYLLALIIISIALIFYSYVVYPLIISLASWFLRRKEGESYSNISEFPTVSILIAAYNEEAVIGRKLDSILSLDYPREKLEVWIGSDASTDRTEEIVQRYAQEYPFIRLVRFEGRTGKAQIINALKKQARGEILVSTDANVIFTPQVISELVAYFSDPAVGMVSANIRRGVGKLQRMQVVEKAYIQRENAIKQKQWLLSGLIMGVEGGCYAIRRSLLVEVPVGFFMDDFFITMAVIVSGYKVAFASRAICFEDIPEKQEEEFERKVRISIGNYQNMLYYRSFLLNPMRKPFFHFFSHKFIRWITPFLLLTSTFASWPLALYEGGIYIYFAAGMTGLMLLPLIRRVAMRVPGFNFITHFVYMNYALLYGFFRYLKRPTSSVWQPVKRNVPIEKSVM